MFAGRKPSSSNVKNMQLFYELKQLYPAASDAALTSCIAAYVDSTNGQGLKSDLVRLLEEALEQNKEDPDTGQMCRPAASSTPPEEPLPLPPPPSNRPLESPPATMESAPRAPPPKRPTHLDVKRRDVEATPPSKKFNIRLSEKCKDVHKLLNSEVSDKPPLSPSSVKRLAAVKTPKSSPDSHRDAPKLEDRSPEAQKRLSQDPSPTKKETCSTPTQTTDTLTGPPTSNLNLSLNVNCSLDLLHDAPPTTRRTSIARLVPAQPWLAPPPAGAAHSPSPRSFTSVNLTLRTPTDTPTTPIDITSKNSTLTYSTSSFDSAKGLQSRLQITVGPAGGSVSSVRVRPKSLHAEEGAGRGEWEEAGFGRTGSLDDLAVSSESPLLLKQQARIERLRLEMKTRKSKLESVKREIEEIEKNRLRLSQQNEEKRLLMDIKHLTYQCKELESDGDAFYSNIYTGQQGPLTRNLASALPSRGPPQPARRPPPASDPEGPKWNCGLCTFLNHPVLDHCEQCEMPRILHGTPIQAVNPHVTIDALRMLNNQSVRAASRSVSLGDAGFYGGGDRPRGGLDSSRSTPNMLGLVHRKD